MLERGTGHSPGMGEIMIGTCSWTDRALVASGWYPRGARDAEGRLRHYASRFPVVEVDATYYALPSARNSELWAERTPPGFVFDVKAFSQLTGHPTPGSSRPPTDDEREVWRMFLDGIAPLRRAGRLGGVLLQFPPWFVPGERARERLARCRDAVPWEVPLTVEFRHPRWLDAPEREETLGLLRGMGLSLAGVDTAQGLPRSMPPVTAVTSERLAVVRFHGRSRSWGTGSKEDRFRHRYGRDELAPWVPRVRALAERADAVHVLFNNCCADAAVSAAETMTELLGAHAAPARPELTPARHERREPPARPPAPS